jgi:MFS superfamily sulfate permease-like transporter
VNGTVSHNPRLSLVDLFSAPFLANIAVVVDEAITNDPLISSDQDTDQIFLTTFLTLTALSLFISGALLVASSAFKLANLGSFLPYPVLAGFFAAVGVMTWTLAFKIDANGRSVGDVFYSGDWNHIRRCFLHHFPSVLVACVMKYLGPKHPFYVVGVLFSTILMFYATMFAFGLSRHDMIEKDWFWSEDDIIYKVPESSVRIMNTMLHPITACPQTLTLFNLRMRVNLPFGLPRFLWAGLMRSFEGNCSGAL